VARRTAWRKKWPADHWPEARWYSSGSENAVEEEVASGFALELAAGAAILGPWVEYG
jgi:hypothetical protein